MNEKTLRRDLHAQAARRGLIVKRDDSRYRAFLHDNYGVDSSTKLTFRQLQEAAGLLRGTAPALARKNRRGERRSPDAPAPFPANPPAARRYTLKKVVSLGQQRHLREPASPAMMKKLFAYGFNALGWDSAAIRAEVLRMTGKDIRDLGRAPDALTVDDVNRIMGSMRALCRHHKKRKEAAP